MHGNESEQPPPRDVSSGLSYLLLTQSDSSTLPPIRPFLKIIVVIPEPLRTTTGKDSKPHAPCHLVVSMRRNLTTILLFFLAQSSACIANDWSQWRGPTRDCHIADADPSAWPDSLDANHLMKAWTVPLSPSYSGPIVVDDRVFVTETRNKSHEVVRALHRQTGEELWSVEWPGAITVPFFAAANGSWIRSTPACDGQYLFVMGIREVLVALEVETGEEVWRVDFVKEYGADTPAFGAVCSPLIDGGRCLCPGRCINAQTPKVRRQNPLAFADRRNPDGDGFKPVFVSRHRGARRQAATDRPVPIDAEGNRSGKR